MSDTPERDPEDEIRDDLPRCHLNGMPAELDAVLHAWLRGNLYSLLSGMHHVGDFLDRLAAAGYRVTPIEAPSFEQLLPPSPD